MPACGYEFYLLVFNSISHSFAALTPEISSWTLADKIPIHARAWMIDVQIDGPLTGRGGGGGGGTCMSSSLRHSLCGERKRVLASLSRSS